jgi:hypothetical protein
MARARARHRRAEMTLPLAVVGGCLPLGVRAYNGFRGNGIVGLSDGITSGLTGYSVFSKRFEMAALSEGLLPILAGILVHKFVGGKLGVNRALGAAKVPLFRI